MPADTQERTGPTEGDAPDMTDTFGANKDVIARPPMKTSLWRWLKDYFVGDDPTFAVALVPFCFVSMLLFTRHPRTNFIFDEQEALLANPYVRSVADAAPKFRWLDAFYRDFWGLGPDRSIGSYRPIPNLVWRALWAVGARDQTAFLHHWINVLFHGLNGALVCVIAFHFTRVRSVAWLAGLAFTTSAVLTEAVSGVVGIADVLGATGALLALLALTRSMPFMGIGVFLATLFGLYSKETALACVPLVPATAVLVAQVTHPRKPRPWLRGLVALAAAGAAFVLYVELRRRMFPAAIPSELSVEATRDLPPLRRAFAAILRWYAQPSLPKDPLNNPLVNADTLHRIGGALRVWFRGLGQVTFPLILSGDYSAPQEPAPTTVASPEIVLGAVTMIAPLVAAPIMGIVAYRRFRGNAAPSVLPAAAAGLLWAVVSYFPVSNIPVLLPTVRAERFWYFPVIGTSLLFGIGWVALYRRYRDTKWRHVATGLVVAFFLFQGLFARLHANDYTDDLTFWDATRKAVPRSAKAHLNYSVMKGARGDLQTRLEANAVALELAPRWPMASIYYGDTLCRLHRAPEAWPHYVRGFELAPNDVNLIALALQCLWDEKMLGHDSNIRVELYDLKEKHKGTWLEYLGNDVLEHGEAHNGVDPKYRPRGYNEGPKE